MRFIAGFLAALLGLAPSLAQAQACAAPPQGIGPAWWSAYKSWCRNSCGGQICDIYNDCRGACNIPARSSGTGSPARAGGSVGEVIGTQLGNALGNLVVCELFNSNCPPGMQRNADNPAARAQYQQMNEEREAMVDRATADQAEKARQSGDRIRAALSGGDSGLRPRDLSEISELQVQQVQGPLGSTEMKPVFGARKAVARYQTATLGPLKQLRCAAALMKKATDLSSTMSVYDRYDASEAAGDYLTGSPASMACAEMDLDTLTEVPTPAAVAVQTKQVLAQSKLFSRIVKAEADVAALASDIRDVKEKEKDAIGAKAQAEQKINALGQEGSSQDPAKKSAMAEALRALEESNRVLKDTQALLKEKEAEKDKRQTDLASTTDLYGQATRSAGDADDILSQIK